MGHSLCVLLVALVLIPCAASAQARVERNVIYGMYSGAALLLDVHYPSTANGVGIIFVPGSGWGSEPEYDSTGIKDGVQPTIWVPPLTDAGYTVFVANHRATPGFHYPAPVEDVQRAVRFVRHHAIRFRVDPIRLGGLGGSSGAHLIALIGTRDGPGASDDADPVNRENSKLQALVLRAAPVDFLVMSGQASAALFEMPGPTPTTPKTSRRWRRYQEASPLTHVSADDPATLLVHGDADQTVPHEQSVAFTAALLKLNVPAKLVTVPGGDHGPTFGLPAGAPVPQNWPDYLAEMVRWFDEHLKTAKATN